MKYWEYVPLNVQAAVPAAVFSALPSWTRDQQIGSTVNHYFLGC